MGATASLPPGYPAQCERSARTRDGFEYARSRGLRRLVGTVLPGNDRMLALARRLGLRVGTSATDPSLITLSMNLGQPAPR